MLGIGIDFGTSNSSVAFFDGEALRYVDLEPDDEPREVMPTALYLDRSFASTVGSPAIARYVHDNAGRTVQLTREEVGEIEITVAGTDKTAGLGDGGAITQEVRVHALTDADMPGRLFRSIKRWLGHHGVERVRVFDRRYRIVALATPVLTRLREAADSVGSSNARAAHVGRSVRYEGKTADASAIALDRMTEACRYAGLPDATLYPEPIAAALSFLHERPAPDGQTVMAFDFGGGTLDLSLVRARGERFRLLASHGTPLGGDTIDRLIYRGQIFPELGEGALVRRPFGAELRTIPFPFDNYAERLLNWTLAYELNRPELLEPIVQGVREGGETGGRLARLYELIQGNHAYSVFRAIESAKVELSDAQETSVYLPELDLTVPLSRREFESLLEPVLAEIDGCVEQVLQNAGLVAEQVDVVVRTGGSSRIPAVIRLLESAFPERVVEHDPFRSIAAGLAIASYHGYRPPPDRPD
ncbi:MAG: Hsp70 family protein [Proteobacteria bacterium]|nr:Hsp70 family protein [Pseudomonadota bacterium]